MQKDAHNFLVIRNFWKALEKAVGKKTFVTNLSLAVSQQLKSVCLTTVYVQAIVIHRSRSQWRGSHESSGKSFAFSLIDWYLVAAIFSNFFRVKGAI